MPPTQIRSEQFTIRRANVEDAVVIANHRARMFQEMGTVPSGAFATLSEKSHSCLQAFLTSGEYIGWLAVPARDPEMVVGGAGVQTRRVLPHPLPASNRIAEGRHAIILNVFTEPAWRRQGVALLLLRQIIQWSRDESLDSLVLHSSEAGHSLYERLGFVSTNEMRFAGEIQDDSDAVND